MFLTGPAAYADLTMTTLTDVFGEMRWHVATKYRCWLFHADPN